MGVVAAAHAVGAPPTGPGAAMAQDRSALSALGSYLGLAPAQQQQLADVQARWQQALVPLRASAARTRDASGRAALCARSRAAHAKHQQDARAVLNDEQRSRLGALEQAFSLMPVVEAAQRGLLLADRLSSAPAGLPTGSVEIEFNWIRAPAPALPGCPALEQKVFKEVEPRPRP